MKESLQATEARASFVGVLSRRFEQFVEILQAALISNHDPVLICEEYAPVLRKLTESSEAQWIEDWRKLTRITSLHPNGDLKIDRWEPYPAAGLIDKISFIDCELWANIADRLCQLDLMARCLHLAWLKHPTRGRPLKLMEYPRRAIHCYLNVARRLGLKMPSSRSLSRVLVAIRLAKKIADSGLLQDCKETCISLLQNHKDYSTAAAYRLMDILAVEGLIDLQIIELCSCICDTAASLAETRPDDPSYSPLPPYMVDELARNYLERRIEWIKKRDPKAVCADEWRRIANMHLRTMTYWSSQPESFNSVAVAAHSAKNALDALEQAGEATETRNALHARLLEMQRYTAVLLRKSAAPAEVDVPLSELASSNVRNFWGRSFLELVGQLLYVRPPDEIQLRQQLQGRSPIVLGIAQSRVASDGRTIGYKEGVDLSTAKDMEAYPHLVELMANWQRRFALAFVLPAIRAVRGTSAASEMASLIGLSGFVPEDRRAIYCRGMLAGLREDWFISTHLLPPQIEHALRNWLQREGLITSNLDRNVQHEQDLNKMLERDDVRSFLGNDLVLDLRASLVHQFGSNLRNLMAHGLLRDDEYESPDACYLWWLAMRLALLWPPMNPADEVDISV